MSSNLKQVIVSGHFDDIRSGDIRLLEEASKLGSLTVSLSTDDAVQKSTGQAPKFPFAERLYVLNAVRYVTRVEPLHGEIKKDSFSSLTPCPDIWADWESPQNASRQSLCDQLALRYRIILPRQLAGFPAAPSTAAVTSRKKIIVTGCYDFFHSGHVRFFEEVSAYGDLFVVVGHDANIRLLKGEGHPLVPADERRYMVGSIRHVTEALVSTGDGWLDAEPEIQRIKPDIYAVNEDGDRGGKREFCEQRGIQYLVLKRLPAPGLPSRTSTDLRGF